MKLLMGEMEMITGEKVIALESLKKSENFAGMIGGRSELCGKIFETNKMILNFLQIFIFEFLIKII